MRLLEDKLLAYYRNKINEVLNGSSRRTKLKNNQDLC